MRIVKRHDTALSAGTALSLCPVRRCYPHDLRLSARLRRFFQQRPGRGPAPFLHCHGNPQRGMGADAGSSHRRGQPLVPPVGGVHSAGARSRRHDPGGQLLRLLHRHGIRPRRVRGGYGQGLRLRPKGYPAAANRPWNRLQGSSAVPSRHVRQCAGYVQRRLVRGRSAGRQAGLYGQPLSPAQPHGSHLYRGDSLRGGKPPSAGPALPHLPCRAGAEQGHGICPSHFLRPAGQHGAGLPAVLLRAGSRRGKRTVGALPVASRLPLLFRSFRYSPGRFLSEREPCGSPAGRGRRDRQIPGRAGPGLVRRVSGSAGGPGYGYTDS